MLSVFSRHRPDAGSTVAAIDIGDGSPAMKGVELQRTPLSRSLQRKQLENVEHRIVTSLFDDRLPLLSKFADCYQGTSTGDNVRYCRNFWELGTPVDPWRRWQSSVVSHTSRRQGTACSVRATCCGTAWFSDSRSCGVGSARNGDLPMGAFTRRYTGRAIRQHAAALIPGDRFTCLPFGLLSPPQSSQERYVS